MANLQQVPRRRQTPRMAAPQVDPNIIRAVAPEAPSRPQAVQPQTAGLPQRQPRQQRQAGGAVQQPFQRPTLG